jgi:hypothetical protein
MLADSMANTGAVCRQAVGWAAQRCIETRLEHASETWQPHIRLGRAERGCTNVTVKVTGGPMMVNMVVKRLPKGSCCTSPRARACH